MPLFPASNILFIHIPKTAGSSIERTLYGNEPEENRYKAETFYGSEPPDWDNYQGYSLQHYTYCDLHSLLGEAKISSFALIFAVVRNPYYRLVSAFYYYYNYIINEAIDYTCIEELQALFSLFCQQFFDGTIYNDGHHRPQYQYLVNANNQIEPRVKVIYFEDLNESFQKLLGLTLINHELKSDRLFSYATHYNEATKRLVADYYARDFIEFGYDPEDLHTSSPKTKVDLSCSAISLPV